MSNEFYRPNQIEFDVSNDGTGIPDYLGDFETPELAHKFINSNLTAMNVGITATRHMDAYEKKQLRDDYSDIMENIIPVYERQLSIAENELTRAKAALKNAEDTYNVTIGQAKTMAAEAKRGLKEMTLDENYTYRIPYQGRYYYFTYIDKGIRLCLIREIPEFEKSEIWNQMAANEEFLNKEPEPAKGKEK